MRRRRTVPSTTAPASFAADDPTADRRSTGFSTKLAVALVGIAALSSGVYAVGALLRPDPPARAGASIESASVAGQIDLVARIEFWSARASATPTDYLSRVQLADVWLERARQSGDAAGYRNARVAIDEALALHPTYRPARATLAAILLAGHDFRGAHAVSTAVVAEDPSQLGALATLGDASLELGDDAAAAGHYATLAAAAPKSPSVTIRQARLAFLHGSASEALDLADTARRQAEAARVVGRSLAWYRTQTAQYARLDGATERARREIDAALELAPSYHVALVEATRVAIAADRPSEALALAQRAVDVVPEPTSLALLADLQDALGDQEGAAATADTLRVVTQLGGEQASTGGRQLALFLADREEDPDRAVAVARAELEQRRDIYSWDALAWAALSAGDVTTATDAAQQALRLGTPDPLLRFHAALVFRAAGDPDRARSLLEGVLDRTPHFDIRHAPQARAVLAELTTTAKEPAR